MKPVSEVDAKIVAVCHDWTEKDMLGYDRHYAGNVVVRCANGDVHTLVNGSFNQVAPENRVQGLKGKVGWITTPSMHLPFFKVPV